MKTTINKCDRCKEITNDLINIQIVNTNVDENGEEKECESWHSMFGSLSYRKSHPTLKKEVCIDCDYDNLFIFFHKYWPYLFCSVISFVPFIVIKEILFAF